MILAETAVAAIRLAGATIGGDGRVKPTVTVDAGNCHAGVVIGSIEAVKQALCFDAGNCHAGVAIGSIGRVKLSVTVDAGCHTRGKHVMPY